MGEESNWWMLAVIVIAVVWAWVLTSLPDPRLYYSGPGDTVEITP